MTACLPPPEMTPAVITGPLCLSEPLPALCALTLHPRVHNLASTLSPQSTQWGGLCRRTPRTAVCASMCPCWAPHCAPWRVGTLGSSLLRPTWVDPARVPAGRSRRQGLVSSPGPHSPWCCGVCAVLVGLAGCRLLPARRTAGAQGPAVKEAKGPTGVSVRQALGSIFQP